MPQSHALRLLCLALSSAAMGAAAAPTYRVSLLEAPPGTYSLMGRYINDDGVIAGDLSVDEVSQISNDHVFRWSEEHGFEIATAPDPRVRSRAVNLDAKGRVQGGRFRWSGPFRVYAWATDGEMTRMGSGTPVSGNRRGDVVGRLEDGKTRVWTADGPALAPAVHFLRYDYLTLNDQRIVGGVAERPDGTSPYGGEATLWDEQHGVRYLGTPAGHPDMSTSPASISEGGVVVGNAFDFVNGGLNEAFRYTAVGGFEFLGQIPECNGHGAAAQNESGTIIGSSVRIDQGHGCGWLWTREDGMRLLYDLIDPSDPLRDVILFQYPSQINAHGQIVGRGRDSFSDVTFVLTPVAGER